MVASPVVVNNAQVGTVHVWAYGAGAVLTDRDAQFRSGSLTALTIAALVAIAIASISGLWYSTRLVRPIDQITETAEALRRGDRTRAPGSRAKTRSRYSARPSTRWPTRSRPTDELERRLTADVAHELRTPLQAIQATVEAMQDGVLPADEERLGIVRDETVRLARLADAILELTRLERGSLPFDMQRIDLGGPVRTAVDSLQALFESKRALAPDRHRAGRRCHRRPRPAPASGGQSPWQRRALHALGRVRGRLGPHRERLRDDRGGRHGRGDRRGGSAARVQHGSGARTTPVRPPPEVWESVWP